MARHSAVLVERTMLQMSFGSAVTSVRSGSTESVSRSPQQGPNTSSSTNARLAATRESGLDL